MSIDKPADDFDLLLHVAGDPVGLLGGKSFPLLESFMLGYRCNLPTGVSFSTLPMPSFEGFVRERFPTSERWTEHLSATCYVHFLGPDDASAFDLYVALCRDYFATRRQAGVPRTSEGPCLYDVLKAVCQRPRMYFIRTPDMMACLIAFLKGGMEAERIHTGTSATAVLLGEFQVWLEARYPWALGRPWHRILSFQNLWHADGTLAAFWTHFDLFRHGESPDAMTPAAKHLFETDPGVEDMSEAERNAWQRNLNRIFYRE
jgi:hypothetical protein